MMTDSNIGEWNHLPPELIVQILDPLSNSDRFAAALTCKNWLAAFKMRPLWKSFEFNYFKPDDERYLKIFHQAPQFRSVVIKHNSNAKCCDFAVQTMQDLIGSCGELSSFEICGNAAERKLEHTSALTELCEACGKIAASSVSNGKIPKHGTGLQELNLAKYRLPLSNILIDSIMLNKYLTSLNIQNEGVNSTVSVKSISRLVERCQHLVELHCHYNVMSDDTLMALATANRDPFRFISILFKGPCREENELSDDAWQALADQWPDYRARLTFNHMVPPAHIGPVLSREILVCDLVLRTFKHVYEQLDIATNHYSATLEKVKIHTSPSVPLFNSLLALVQMCINLKGLHVFCSLPHDLINKIYNTRPNLKDTTDVTLCKEEMGVLVFVGKPQERK